MSNTGLYLSYLTPARINEACGQEILSLLREINIELKKSVEGASGVDGTFTFIRDNCYTSIGAFPGNCSAIVLYSFQNGRHPKVMKVYVDIAKDICTVLYYRSLFLSVNNEECAKYLKTLGFKVAHKAINYRSNLINYFMVWENKNAPKRR